MTTKAATLEATAADDRVTLEATVVALEALPQAQFRAAAGPAAGVERRATQIGADDLAMRARLLRAMALVREGTSEQGGRWAHQVLAWAQDHRNMFVVARAHRVLSIFYRQIGDLAEALAHAVQCFSQLGDDEPDNIRARHMMTLAVGLDETGSVEEGDRRFDQALNLATSAGDTELILNILNNMAYTAFERDNETHARDLVVRMRQVQAGIGREFGALELDTIARVEMMGEHFDAVEQTLRTILDDGPDSAVESHEGDATAVCMLTLAEARRLARRYRAAQRALDAAIKVAELRGLDRVRAQAREEQAALLAATGRFQEAYEEYRAFHRASMALQSAQREARARALHAVFEATEARRTSEQFREMAYRDALTGLYNRRYVNEQLPTLLDHALDQQLPLSVAMLDLDHFKQVNDTLSHSIGDTVLQHIGQLMTQAVIEPMIAARLGGEEFLLILPNMDAPQAAAHCEMLRLQVRSHAWKPITRTMPITVSIGVAAAENGSSPSTLLSTADRNLYQAKREGRDRVVARS